MKKVNSIFFSCKQFICLIGCILLFSEGSLKAQRVEAEAILSNDKIKIGEQVDIKFAVRYREGSKKAVVIWPILSDTLTSKIEIVKSDSIITNLANRASVLYQQAKTLTITAFDSGMFIIPAQQFIVDQDTVHTDPIALYVTSVPVDTTRPIKDIKALYDVPPPPITADASESNHWWIWTLVGLVGVGLIFLILYFVRKKKIAPEIISPVFSRTILPHEKYLEQLAKLGREKPWMQNELKKYHIALTEILRSWMVERYRIHAKEMTTVEIIRALKSLNVNPNAILQLERALRMADMVKFAKWNASNEENENSLQLAINFVITTAESTQIQAQPQLGFQR